MTASVLCRLGESMGLQSIVEDFRLAILTLLGACAVFGLFPFAIYRLLAGDYLIGILDALIVFIIAGGVAHAWWSGRVELGARLIVCVTCSGGLLMALLHGDGGLFWLYVVFVANFCLVRARLAVALTAGTIAVLLLVGTPFESDLHAWAFVTTSSMVCAFILIFVKQAERQQRRLREFATRDPLTGVGNRRTMEEELQIAIAAKERDEAGYGVIMFDLDHFKRINDRFGHDEGDRLLIKVCEIVRRRSRRNDRLFRFGGEEFVVLLSGIDVHGLYVAAEQLRQSLEDELKDVADGVTASFGAALLQPKETQDEWLRRADRALYRAKASGRNRVALAECSRKRAVISNTDGSPS
ncbi:GGDEF domain-containing protein [Alkalilimnicola ehrlichii]|nr:GGDEF domain-containing protein [Alkalilimnicola ehrlichii]